MGGMIGQTNDNDDTLIKGGTDSSVIGNVGDRLKVTTNGTIWPQISAKFRSVFASPAQTITGSTYTSIFTYSGSGSFVGCILDTSQDGFQLKVLIDGTEILVADISGTNLNGSGLLGGTNLGGSILSRGAAGLISFNPPYPVPYTTSVQILGKRDNAGSVVVNNYFVYLTKET